MVKYVITGGPGVGKSTTISELQRLGYATVPEAARAIIAEEQGKPDAILPWTNLYEFQRKVLQRQLDLEGRLNGAPAFLDRGVIDNIAYCRMGKVSVPPEVVAAIQERRYARVFLLDPLPKYQIDTERKEDHALAARLHQEIARVYQECGYRIVQVPVLPPGERAKYVVSRI